MRGPGCPSLALVLVLGCAKAHPSPPPLARHGESSFRTLAETEVVSGEPEPSPETITAIHPFAENLSPSYPADALSAGCGDGLVPVRVHVGIDGRVSDVRRIPGRVVAGDACHGMLETAVRQALAGWQFVPAYRIRRLAAETPGQEPTVERVPLGLDLDYEFVFTVVDGKGSVRSKE
jgi:outer membrane biosynthesis protein TonB